MVVDNNSNDGSVEKLNFTIMSEGWSGWVSLTTLNHNGGFAYGNNAGIRAAFASVDLVDNIILLNPDTIARPGAVRKLVIFLDQHPRVGIAGSMLENKNGGIERSAHRYHSPLSELNAGARLGLLTRLLRRYVDREISVEEAQECDWVSGACLIVRREVIEKVGFMDEGYFLYFEEVDFCRKAQHAGWECWYVPESRVMHLEGASTGINSSAKRRAKYWYDSRRRYFVKHYGTIGLIGADLLWAIGRLSFLLRRTLHMGARGNNNDPKWYMFDLLWGDLWAILKSM